jgi:hypothetical protein
MPRFPPSSRRSRQSRITWAAYPKARQLGTDLNRDILSTRLLGHGLDAVRQVAIDATWSAMRFKLAV